MKILNRIFSDLGNNINEFLVPFDIEKRKIWLCHNSSTLIMEVLPTDSNVTAATNSFIQVNNWERISSKRQVTLNNFRIIFAKNLTADKLENTGRHGAKELLFNPLDNGLTEYFVSGKAKKMLSRYGDKKLKRII